MNSRESLNIERDLATALVDALKRVPWISQNSIYREPVSPNDHREDFRLLVVLDDETRTILCEVKTQGFPKQVRQAAQGLRLRLNSLSSDHIGVIGAPYLSKQSRDICAEFKLGFIDLAGNCRLVGPGFFVEHVGGEPPKSDRRAFVSIFSPKSAHVLRALFRDPHREWKVADLAEASGVSVGQVSNVRSALINNEWAIGGGVGLSLTQPDALLDAWRDDYKPPKARTASYYTTLHGPRLDESLGAVLGDHDTRAMLAGPSAANWLAPFARGHKTYLYADPRAAEHLVERLALQPVTTGANVEIKIVEDEAFFSDRSYPAPSVATTSAVQTYLDLWILGERGREAADHLREAKLTWS